MTSFNPDLVEDVARRRSVLFLGAGVSAGATTNSGRRIRQWGQFLAETADLIQDDEVKQHAQNLISEKDFLMACEIIREAIGPSTWEDELRNEYTQIGNVTQLHKAIISLNQRIIVTTNFDKLLETAWNQCNPSATHYPKIEIGISEESFQIFRDNREYIIKLHGSVDVPESIIFAKSDYNRKAYGSWAYTKFIETMLMTHTMLFIGFSLNDPAIAFILEMYAQHLPKARPHYIFSAGPVSQNYIQITKRLRRIFILPYDESNDHAELVSIIEALGQQASVRRREIAAEEWNAVQGATQ